MDRIQSAWRGLAVSLVLVLLSGCGAVHGVGQGVEDAGEGIQDASDPNEPDESVN